MSDKINKFIFFHTHEMKTLAQLKYHCSLLFTCSRRSLVALNQFLEAEHRNCSPSSTSEGTKMKVAIQGGGERGAYCPLEACI